VTPPHTASNVPVPAETFSLLGGPLHRLACRIGLVRHGTDTIRLGLVLGGVPWVIGALLAAVEGTLPQMFSIDVIGAHVRLLVAIPLFFVCESMFHSQQVRFAHYCSGSGLVTGEALTVFERVLARTMRWKHSQFPDLVCLGLAVAMAIAAPDVPWGGTTSELEADRSVSLAGWWYWIVCLTLFRFLLFRWIWHLAVWWYLLWRLSRLDLHMRPAHPDGSGGLGLLEHVHTQLAPLVFGLGAVLSASFAEDISTGRTPLEVLYPSGAAMLLVALVLVAGPLAIFTPRLWTCRQQGLRDYAELASRYATKFDQKWLGRDAAPGEPMLGSADIQSLADLSNAVNIVRDMRLIPAGRRLLLAIAAATLLPLLPLLTLRYPISTMIDQIVNRLIGL
jgi:hypothetical protein